MKKGIYLNDSIHGLIPLSEYEKRIISSVGFNRLHDVYQNSTVYLTFPTNRTLSKKLTKKSGFENALFISVAFL